MDYSVYSYNQVFYGVVGFELFLIFLSVFIGWAIVEKTKKQTNWTNLKSFHRKTSVIEALPLIPSLFLIWTDHVYFIDAMDAYPFILCQISVIVLFRIIELYKSYEIEQKAGKFANPKSFFEKIKFACFKFNYLNRKYFSSYLSAAGIIYSSVLSFNIMTKTPSDVLHPLISHIVIKGEIQKELPELKKDKPKVENTFSAQFEESFTNEITKALDDQKMADINLIRWLVSNGALNEKTNESVLLKAIELESHELLSFLLSKGANPNHLLSYDHEELGKYRLMPLEGAFMQGDLKAVDLLIKAGANPALRSHKDLPLLYYASYARSVETLEKAQKLFPSTKLNILDQYGHTPLYLAAIPSYKRFSSENDVEYVPRDTAIAKFLLDQGADPNFLTGEDHNKSAVIDLASEFENIEMLKLLIDHGADVNQKDNDGASAIFSAAKADDHETMAFLIEHGAKIDLTKELEEKILKAYKPQNAKRIITNIKKYTTDEDNRIPASEEEIQ
jgi:ankyrin repeat protein